MVAALGPSDALTNSANPKRQAGFGFSRTRDYAQSGLARDQASSAATAPKRSRQSAIHSVKAWHGGFGFGHRSCVDDFVGSFAANNLKCAHRDRIFREKFPVPHEPQYPQGPDLFPVASPWLAWKKGLFHFRASVCRSYVSRQSPLHQSSDKVSLGYSASAGLAALTEEHLAGVHQGRHAAIYEINSSATVASRARGVEIPPATAKS